jgi:hypothetical protein
VGDAVDLLEIKHREEDSFARQKHHEQQLFLLERLIDRAGKKELPDLPESSYPSHIRWLTPTGLEEAEQETSNKREKAFQENRETLQTLWNEEELLFKNSLKQVDWAKVPIVTDSMPTAIQKFLKRLGDTVLNKLRYSGFNK